MGLDGSAKLTTRRWYYLIPARGEPRALVHRIERHSLEHLGVARQIKITAELKSAFPELTIVGSGYSYLQDWLPNVAQAAVREGMTDFVGLGRMALSYPELPADLLSGKTLQRKRICRTFSDCTTAPRNGMVSGCYPLDDFYKSSDEFAKLAAIKKETAR